jgi:hypothetical protein
MLRLFKSLLAGTFGAGAGLVLGFVCGCGFALGIMDCRLLYKEGDPRIAPCRAAKNTGTYVGPLVGAVAGVAYVNWRKPKRPTEPNDSILE